MNFQESERNDVMLSSVANIPYPASHMLIMLTHLIIRCRFSLHWYLPNFRIIKFIRFFDMQVTVGPYQLHDVFIPQAVVELGVDQTKRWEVTLQPLEISIWWYDTNNSKFVHINLNDSFSQINLAVNYFKKLFATILVFTHSLWSSWDLFSTSLASELLLLWWFPHVLWSLNQHHFLIESEWTKLYIKDR